MFVTFLQFLVDHGVTVAIVATKIDKLSSREADKAVNLITNTFNRLASVAATKFAQGERGGRGEEEDTSTYQQQLQEEEDWVVGGEAEGILSQQVVPVISFSSVTGQGKSDLWKVIRDNIIATSSS